MIRRAASTLSARTVGLTVGLSALALGCAEDSGTSSVDVGTTIIDAGKQELPPPAELPPVELPPLTPCEVVIGVPQAGAIMGQGLTIGGAATHATLEIAKAAGFAWPGSCAAPPADVDDIQKLPDIAAADFQDGSFGWLDQTIDIPPYTTFPPLFEHPLPTVCVQVVAEVKVPDAYPEGTVAPTCSAQREFQIDRECPAVLRHAPTMQGEVGFEPYVDRLPIDIEVYDPSGVASVRVLANDGTELKRFEPETPGAMDAHFTGELDVSTWSTGTHALRFESTDGLGNTCTRIITDGVLRPGGADVQACPLIPSCAVDAVSPNVVRAPAYLAASRQPPGPEPAASISSADMDGDGKADVLALTKSGKVEVFLGDGAGGLAPGQIQDVTTDTVVYVSAAQLNPSTDNLPDLVLVSKGANGTASLRAYIQVTADHPAGGVCLPDPSAPVIAGEPPPVTCTPGWALVQEFELPVEPTAFMYRDVAVDPALPDTVKFDELPDVVLGNKEDQYAVAMVVADAAEAVDWEDADGNVVTMDACDYRPPQFLPDGAVLPSAPAACFHTPTYFAGIGNIIALGASDLLEDKSGGIDIIASRDGPTRAVTVHRHNGRGEIKQAFTWGEAELPAAAVQIIAGQYSFDNDAKYDVMLVLRDAGQLWQIMGTGGSEFKGTGTAVPETLHRVICVEGKPVSVVYEDVGGNPTIPGNPPNPPDILVANAESGTLWTYLTEALVPEGTTTLLDYRPPTVTGLGLSPVQMVSGYFDADAYIDVAVLGADGAVEVLRSSNPDLPPTDPAYGPRGTFAGPRHVTTPIVPQSNRTRCDVGVQPTTCVEPWEALTSVASSVSLGTPEDRLEPTRMVIRDVNADGHEDLILVCASAETATKCASTGQVERRIPVLPFHATEAPFFPTTAQPVSEINPATAYCDPAGGTPCAAGYWGPKGEVTAVVAGNFDFAAAQDLALVTDTSYLEAQCPEGNPTHPLDLMINQQGKGSRFVQRQVQPSPDNTPLVACGDIPALAGKWTMFGFQDGLASRPKAVATLSCDKNQDTTDDLVILGERQAKDGLNIVHHDQVQVFKMANGTLSTAGTITGGLSPKGGYFEIGKVTQDVFAARLGKKHGAQPPATIAEVDGEDDFVVVTNIGVQIFEGRAGVDCNFVKTGAKELGTDVRGATITDLDGDRYTDFVGALGDGTVTVSYGVPKDGVNAQAYDSVDWEPPSIAVRTGTNTITRPRALDVNGDKLLDLVVLVPGPQAALMAFLNTGLSSPTARNRFLETPYRIPVAPGTVTYEFVDFDKDGCLDLVSLSPTAKAAELQRSVLPSCQ